jgi:hypothetical protein
MLLKIDSVLRATNRWYDQLDRTHPIARFFLAMALMLPFCGLTFVLNHWGKSAAMLVIGWTFLVLLTRCYPVFVTRRPA